MMTQTLILGGKEFVVLLAKDFRELQRRASDTPRKRRRLASARDRADVELAKKRLSDPKERPVPYKQARRELGLT
jgi:hypothetical protein